MNNEDTVKILVELTKANMEIQGEIEKLNLLLKLLKDHTY